MKKSKMIKTLGEIETEKKLVTMDMRILGWDGKPLRKEPKRLPKKENRILCIYVPNSWPFCYTKFFKNFLNIIHPRNIVQLRSLGITDYFTLISNKFPVCRNRNEAVRTAQQHNADLIMFLDSDMRQPPDIIYKLAKHDLPIVSGMYFHQSPPHFPVVYKHKVGHEYTHFYNYPKHEIYDADLVGLGCLLVDMRVFAEMKMPYFYYGSSREDGIVDITEDVPFCERARELGYSIIVDPTVQCTHIKIDEITYAAFDAYMDQYHDYQKLLELQKKDGVVDGNISADN